MADGKIGVAFNTKDTSQTASKLLVVLSFTPSETTSRDGLVGAQDESSMSGRILPMQCLSHL